MKVKVKVLNGQYVCTALAWMGTGASRHRSVLSPSTDLSPARGRTGIRVSIRALQQSAAPSATPPVP